MGGTNTSVRHGNHALPLFLITAALLWPQAGSGFTWSQRADVIGESFGRGLHAGGVIDNKVYVAGGGFWGDSLWVSYRSTVIYDPVADSWTTGRDMTALRAAPASAVASVSGASRLFVIGGLDFTGFPVDHFNRNSIEAYDPATNTWQLMTAVMPDKDTWASCAVTVDNLIYVMGGSDDSVNYLSDRMVAYDPQTDTMVSKAVLPAKVSDGACAALGRKIYWFSGYEDSRGWGALPIDQTFIYDVDTDAWSVSASAIPTPRADTAAIAIGFTIYLVGGWNGSGQVSGFFNSVDAYDTLTDTWTADVPDPIGCMEDDGINTRGRAGLSLHAVNDGVADEILAVGGNVGISLPTRCNESTGIVPSTDTEPPVFGGLETAAEVFCTAPEVSLQWSAGTDSRTPPVVYNVYRGTSPSFVPGAANLVASRVAALTRKDTLTMADCYASYWYVVRAQDAASPPNEDTNTKRVQVDLQCVAPNPPASIANRLAVTKDPSGSPSLDWSQYAPAPAVTHYHVRRTLAKLGLPGNIIDEPAVGSYVDTAATGGQYYYEVRSAMDCQDMESAD